MNAATRKQFNWFWPWQDEQEEAWLEKKSQAGWHLQSVHLPCVYIFVKGEPTQYIYRLDYQRAEKGKLLEYQQIFQDAGWEYLGEMTNWRYWRNQAVNGFIPEIFSDLDSKLKKYKRILGYMAFFLVLLVFMGLNLLNHGLRFDADTPALFFAIYLVAGLLYALVIPMYVVIVVQILRRINRLKKKIL
jgi:hypothetical protein